MTAVRPDIFPFTPLRGLYFELNCLIFRVARCHVNEDQVCSEQYHVDHDAMSLYCIVIWCRCSRCSYHIPRRRRSALGNSGLHRHLGRIKHCTCNLRSRLVHNIPLRRHQRKLCLSPPPCYLYSPSDKQETTMATTDSSTFTQTTEFLNTLSFNEMVGPNSNNNA